MTESNVLDKVEKKELESRQEKSVPAKHYVPYTDIFENDDALMVVMDIPGAEPKQLDINLEKNVLSIEGWIDFSKYDHLQPLYSEYNVGHFSRSFSLSSEIDQSGITAKVEDGVLTLTLPKAEEATTRRIEVH
jgi:HSP20 family molecular chaperone IbpA